jgi:broad specificity phosphatase PhoE
LFIIDLVPHMDAGDRDAWPGDQDERPLTALGRQQAAALAEALSGLSIDGLYAGPALRCRQTLGALGERLRLAVEVMPGLGEKVAWQAPDGWEPGISRAAFAAGTMARSLEDMRSRHPNGRAVACSHGHTIPALVAYQMGMRGSLDLPPLDFPLSYADPRYRGQWFRLSADGAAWDLERVSVPNFPG